MDKNISAELVKLGGKLVEVEHILPPTQLPLKKVEENLYDVFVKYEKSTPENS